MLVVTHKDVVLPKLDQVYQVITVGQKKDELSISDVLRDDQGDNISEKNKNYSELTALYWAWKNLHNDFDAVGIVHYRRMFMSERNKQLPVSSGEISHILKSVDVILPRKRNYFIETTWSQYEHAHYIGDLESVRKVIAHRYSNYLPAFDSVMKRRKSHRFNMMIMKRNIFNNYMSWLFDILFTSEKEIDTSAYDMYNSRVYGFLSERLLDVWIEANGVKYSELPVRFLEKENWLVKGGNFLWRKLTGSRRTKSNL
jgi:hypothetical protein